MITPWDKDNRKKIMKLDLRKGYGDFEDYKLTKFPDNSIKFELKPTIKHVDEVITTLRNNDDIITLMLVSDVLSRVNEFSPNLFITYMMYQQDDRLFNKRESFGLKVVSNIINNSIFDKIEVFHPHSDKVEFINNCVIMDNMELIKFAIIDMQKMKRDLIPLVWVIPDAGAFKTQLKQIETLRYPDFLTCMKSRNHESGEITTVVNTEDLQGKDCFIVDDICLGGRTFKNIAKELKAKNCGKIFLVVSHGVFNHGTEELLQVFDGIYTTNSICTLEASEQLKIVKL